ncbi:MAG: D-glycero-beta-D-manno-heptose-7-phosphate kinase [Candidatus Omnitrophota bacterium]
MLARLGLKIKSNSWRSKYVKKYKYSTLANIIKKFDSKSVIVIGDLLLDQFISGEVSRISPEAPVPVVWVKNEGYMPGGACNVACNLAELGAKVSLIGIVGQDEKADMLKRLLAEKNISVEGIIADKERPTILKTRVIANRQQVVRIDREDIRDITGKYVKRIHDYLIRNIDRFDGIIIEDYGKGLITPELLKKVVPLAKKHNKIIAVDPKENHFSFYKDVDVLTPNNHEASKAVGFKIDSGEKLRKAGDLMLKKLKVKVVLITLGEDGMMVFEKGKAPRKIPTLAQEVFDVSGAGDTVIATYVLCIISGASPIVAAHVANCAAGIVVGKVGVAVVNKEELKNRLKRETGRAKQ